MRAVLMVAAGVLTPEQAYQAIDWDTLVLLLGMFLLAGCLRLAGFFDWAAETTLRHVRTPMSLMGALVLVSGVLSALLVNDTVCVMLAPLVIALMERAALPIRPYLFALAAGTNIGGVMTVVGNPQNMIIAHAAPVPSVSFARALVPVGFVSLGLTVGLLRWSFRSQLAAGPISIRANGRTQVDGRLLAPTLACFALVIVGFIAGLDLAWTALAGAVIAVVISGRPPRQVLAQVDGPLLMFFAELFVVVGGLEAAHILALAARLIQPLIDAPGALGAFHLSWISTVASNVVSNVPWVLVAIRWVGPDGGGLHPWLLLALTSTFAGNLTLFGSVANVIVFEAAHERIGFWEFLRIGAPLTLLTTGVGVGLMLFLT